MTTILRPQHYESPAVNRRRISTGFLTLRRNAAVALVLGQLPLTLANSCLAPADAARTYFDLDAERGYDRADSR